MRKLIVAPPGRVGATFSYRPPGALPVSCCSTRLACGTGCYLPFRREWRSDRDDRHAARRHLRWPLHNHGDVFRLRKGDRKSPSVADPPRAFALFGATLPNLLEAEGKVTENGFALQAIKTDWSARRFRPPGCPSAAVLRLPGRRRRRSARFR